MNGTTKEVERANRPRIGTAGSPPVEASPDPGREPDSASAGALTTRCDADPNLVLGALGMATFLVVGAVGLYHGDSLGIAEPWSLPTGITREAVFATGTATGLAVALLNLFGSLWRRTAPTAPEHSRVMAGLLAAGMLVPVGLLLQVFLPIPVGVVAFGGMCLILAMALIVVTEHRLDNPDGGGDAPSEEEAHG